MPKEGKAAKAPAKKAPATVEEKSSVFEKDWKVEHPIEANHIFGQSWVMIHMEADKQVEAGRLLMKEYITNSEADAVAHAEIMKKRMAIDHAHVMRLHDWSCHKKSDWCSSYYKFKAFYTYPGSNLRTFIQNLKGAPVPHEDLTHIMYQMLFALEYLHTQGQAFNDVRPEYIGKLSQEHSWMLCDRLSAPGSAYQAQRKNFEDIFQHNGNRRYYAAPEVFKLCTSAQKGKVPKVDEFKADVWSLGWVLLSAGIGLTVKDHNAYYTVPSKGKPASVDMNKINAAVAQFKANYEKDSNSILGMVVELCMKEDPAERLTMHDLLHHPEFGLPNYQEVIDHFHDQDVNQDHRPEFPPNIPRPEIDAGHERPHVDPPHVDPPVEVVHVDHSNVVTTHEVREPKIVHESQATETRYTTREPQIIREYIKLDGTRTSHVPDHVHEHVHVEPTTTVVREPVTTVVREEPKVIRSRVVSHRGDAVVRRSHHSHRAEPTVIRGETKVIRGEPVVIRGDAVVRDGSHVEHRTSHVEGERVVRRVAGHSDVVVNHGDHHHHVVSGDVVRGSRVVRHVGETVHAGHVHGDVVRSAEENVKVIRDPVLVAEYKARMEAEGRTFETKPAHVEKAE